MVWYSGAFLSPRGAAHPFDGDSFFVSDGVETLLYHGYASSSRLTFQAPGGKYSGGAVYLVTERLL